MALHDRAVRVNIFVGILTTKAAIYLLRSFGSNTPPLGAKIEFGFAKLFSKASKIPRLLAAGIFLLFQEGQP